jgi:hypothetical protein
MTDFASHFAGDDDSLSDDQLESVKGGADFTTPVGMEIVVELVAPDVLDGLKKDPPPTGP